VAQVVEVRVLSWAPSAFYIVDRGYWRAGTQQISSPHPEPAPAASIRSGCWRDLAPTRPILWPAIGCRGGSAQASNGLRHPTAFRHGAEIYVWRLGLHVARMSLTPRSLAFRQVFRVQKLEDFTNLAVGSPAGCGLTAGRLCVFLLREPRRVTLSSVSKRTSRVKNGSPCETFP
jgi:hypothetical protein